MIVLPDRQLELPVDESMRSVVVVDEHGVRRRLIPRREHRAAP